MKYATYTVMLPIVPRQNNSWVLGYVISISYSTRSTKLFTQIMTEPQFIPGSFMMAYQDLEGFVKLIKVVGANYD